MRWLTPVALLGVLVLVVVPLAAAQQTPQPVARLGNFIEVGNDVRMHIHATGDFRYQTTENFDFERKVRDRVASRVPNNTMNQLGDGDHMWSLLRFGVNFQYQQSLTLHLTAEQRSTLDGNITDSRANSSSPGGVDVFGRAATGEDNGLHLKLAWLDYTFQGTPLRMRVGFDFWRLDQAGLIGDNDPRFALFANFGDLDLLAAAVIQFESLRLGLTNDNDAVYYTFSAGYNLRPHRFQLDVTYFRDRFNGADTRSGAGILSGLGGFQGQKIDSVLIMGSWGGAVGPVRGLVQGNLIVGRARGGTTVGLAAVGLASVVPSGRTYGILAGGVVAYAEADLDIVRPFVGFIWGSADGDPTDNRLHGFNPTPYRDIILMTDTTWFAHLDTSNAFARDYACPARAQGLGVGGVGAPGLTRLPQNAGIVALGGGPGNGFTECSHTVTTPFNDKLGGVHLGIITTYSNPGTLVIPVGLRVFPWKDHEFTGWYLYRGMVDTTLLKVAFAPELAARGMRGIRQAEYHEIGGFWTWTPIPNFDIRLAGNIAIPGGGYRDLAHLANCNPGGAGPYVTSTPCSGKDPALHAEVRFRARF